MQIYKITHTHARTHERTHAHTLHLSLLDHIEFTKKYTCLGFEVLKTYSSVAVYDSAEYNNDNHRLIGISSVCHVD